MRPSTAVSWFVSSFYELFEVKTLSNNVFWVNVDHILSCHSMAKWQMLRLNYWVLGTILVLGMMRHDALVNWETIKKQFIVVFVSFLKIIIRTFKKIIIAIPVPVPQL